MFLNPADIVEVCIRYIPLIKGLVAIISELRICWDLQHVGDGLGQIPGSG